MGSNRISDFLYPREGTETPLFFLARPEGAWIFFIPARGRKQRGGPARVIKSGFSLSPRGDGNIVFSQSQPNHAMIFFIPARGRKPIVAANGVIRVGFSLSPRGDGNQSVVTLCPLAFLIFFIPARGRKPNGYFNIFLEVDFLYPARGRKLDKGNAFTDARAGFSLSPQGATIPNKNRHFCHPSIYKQCVMC